MTAQPTDSGFDEPAKPDWIIDHAIGFMGEGGKLRKIVTAEREYTREEWESAHPGIVPHRIMVSEE